MKTKLIIMLLSTLFALDAMARMGQERIVVISDIHLLSPELVTPGTAHELHYRQHHCVETRIGTADG